MGLLWGCWHGAARAQVQIASGDGQIVIDNAGLPSQRIVFAGAGKSGATGPVVMDEGGNTYEVCSASCPTGATCNLGGYQSGSEADPDLVRGAAEVIRYLVAQHGAAVEFDADLSVYVVGFPQQADPIAYLFGVLTTERLDGRLLVDYFRFVEVNTQGTFDDPYAAAKPGDLQFAFPNDPFYSKQWNLARTRLAKAQWHPARARREVRIGVIDSGVGPDDRQHAGLDGTEVIHRSVAPTTGFPAPHALSILTLLGDRAHDGDGVVGLLGDAWTSYGDYDHAPLLARRPPRIYSYNVGDFGPGTVAVARAIRQSLRDNVDILNLSVALAPSPTVEEAIREALRRRVLVVAAAGNYAPDAAYKPAKFPANIRGVLSIGAGTRERTFSAFSANEGVDLLAPGEDLLLGGPGNIWYEGRGTSFAAPHVVAALTMMLAVEPDLRPSEAIDALLGRAQAREKNGGVGFLSALSALNEVLPRRERVADDEIPLPHLLGEEGAGKDAADGYDPSVDAGLYEARLAAGAELPADVVLEGNYPNPFNPATAIRFALPQGQRVRLAVYNTLGQEVQVLADGFHEAGHYDVRFEAGRLASGVYVARLETEGATRYRNMVLMK